MKIENTKKEVKSYKGILTKYQALPENIQKYFGHIPKLINDDYEYEIVIAYLFLKIEEGQNRLLYGGSVKCLGAEAEVATSIINYHHLKRNDFGKIYRAKGIVKIDGYWGKFNLVYKNFEMEPIADAKGTKIVIIGNNLNIENLKNI